MNKHFLVLDSFRGICACIVALSHFMANSIFYKSSIFDVGSVYVDFFFVLSGFVIAANYQTRISSGREMGKFVFLRIGRLYPLHVFVLMAFVGGDLAQLIVNTGDMAEYAPFSAPGESFGDIVAAFFLVHSLHVTESLAFNGPSWSISVEFYTYILYALVVLYSGKRFAWVMSALAVFCAVALYFLYGELYAKLDYGFLRCVYGFSCGVLTYLLYQKRHDFLAPFLKNDLRSNVLEVGLLTAVLSYIAFFSLGALSFFAPLVFSVVIFFFAFEAGALSDLLKKKVFLLLGTLSYSIYMIHLFISGKFFALPIRLLENRLGWNISIDVGGAQLYGTNLFYGTILELFYLAVVVACAFVTYKLIEEPCRKWSRKVVSGNTKFRSLPK